MREWLAGMTVGRHRRVRPRRTARTRCRPSTRRSSPALQAPTTSPRFAQYTALFGELEQRVVECFRNGGGVPYRRCRASRRCRRRSPHRSHNAGLIDVTLPLVEGLVDRLRSGIDVIDVGCGHGHAANLIADAFPASRVTGIDISEQGIAAARAEADELRLTNARFEVRDALSLEPASYDLVTAFDVIHDLPAPAETLAAIHAALRADGIFLMVDIAASSELHENLEHPLGPALYTASIFHCMTVSLANDGPGLGTMWGEQTALELLRAAGFENVEVERVEADILNAYYIARKR